MRILTIAALLAAIAIVTASAQSNCTTTCANQGGQRVCNTQCW